MDIEIERIGNEIVALRIDGVEFDTDDGETWIVPKRYLNKVKTASLPKDVKIDCCDSVEPDMIFVDTVPYTICGISQDQARVEFDESTKKISWDDPIDLVEHMEAKREIIKQFAMEFNNINLDSYEDDVDHTSLCYSAIFKGGEVQQIIYQAEELITKINGITELQVGSPFQNISKWISIAEKEPRIVKVLKQFTSGSLPLEDLYVILEDIEYDIGGIGRIITNEWAAKNKLNLFKRSAQQYRHGEKKGFVPPKNSMSVVEANSLIQSIARKWIQSKV
jgi:hypothetical protein